jgi:hypothetical protein
VEFANTPPNSLGQLYTDLKYLAGKDAAQTEVVSEAPVSAAFDSKHATVYVMTKEFDSTAQGGSGIAEVLFTAENIDSPSEIQEGDSVELRQVIQQIGVSEQELAKILATLLTELDGTLDLASIGTGGSDANATLRFSPDALTGVNLDGDGLLGIQPEYGLDAKGGTINATDYAKNGAAINDWTEVLGSPNRLTWSGDAEATRFDSTLATGTAPISVASTTECPNLDAEFHEGLGWHAGVDGRDTGVSYGASDTTICSCTLNGAAGSVWDVTGVLAITSNDALDIDAKLKVSGGAQIGDTVTVKGITGDTLTQSVLVSASYTATTGTETINLTVGVPTGTGSTASGAVLAHRVR